MTQKNRWQTALAGLTLTLLACEDSITGIPDPVADFEMAQSAALSTGGCLPPAAGLISWWPGEDVEDKGFDDIALLDDGTEDPNPNHIAFVSFGTGVDGLGVGGRTDPSDPAGTVTLGDGKVGNAFKFTSVHSVQFLEVEDAPDLQQQNFTIDLWAKLTGPGLTDDPFGNVLIQKEAPGELIPISYSIWWNDQNTIHAWVNYGGAFATLQSAAPNTPDGWVHIALTADGSKTTLYVNAVATSVPADGPKVLYGGGPVVIGSAIELARLTPDFKRGFHGLIDEVDFFNRALMLSEIEDIYAAGSAGKCEITDNTAPVVTAGPYTATNEGELFQPTVSFVDDDSAPPWMVTVDYGEGARVDFDVNTTSFPLSHTYAQNDTYTVEVTVTDSEGAVGSPIPATVVVHNTYPLTIDQANVRLAKGRSWGRSRHRDAFDVDGTLPNSLLQLVGSDEAVIRFAGFVQVIAAESFVLRNHKWTFRASRRTPGIQKIDVYADGRFQVRATGLNLRGEGFDFSGPVDFSLKFGPDLGKASIQFDRRLRFRAPDDDDDKSGRSDRSARSDKSDKSDKSGGGRRGRR